MIYINYTQYTNYIFSSYNYIQKIRKEFWSLNSDENHYCYNFFTDLLLQASSG